MLMVMWSRWQVSRGRAPEVRPPDARAAELQAAGGAGAEDRGAAALPLQDAGAGVPARLAQTRYYIRAGIEPYRNITVPHPCHPY